MVTVTWFSKPLCAKPVFSAEGLVTSHRHTDGGPLVSGNGPELQERGCASSHFIDEEAVARGVLALVFTVLKVTYGCFCSLPMLQATFLRALASGPSEPVYQTLVSPPGGSFGPVL